MKIHFLRGLLMMALLAASTRVRAQAPTWQTALLAGGNAYSQVTATATDASGNVYIAGYFTNATIVLGTITLTNRVTTGSTVGMSADFFLAKWSPASRTFLWAQRAGGYTNDDRAVALAVSGSSIYAAATLNVSGFGGAAVARGDYIAKFSDAGSLGWVQPAGMTVASLAASSNGLYVAGYFEGAASFGSLSLTSAGNQDIVVAKLADMGSASSYVWAKRAGGAASDLPGTMVVNGATIYLTAEVNGLADFGLLSVAASAGCVARLTDAGGNATFDWVQSVPNAFFQFLTVSNSRVYVAGGFVGTATFGTTSMAAPGTGGYLVACLTDAGTSSSFAWAQRINSAGNSARVDALVKSGQRIYAAGRLVDAMTFGGSTFTYADNNIFVAQLADGGSTGSFNWVLSAPANFTPYPVVLAASGTTIYVAGFVGGPVTFGGLPLSGNGPVAFLASLVDNAALASAIPAALPGLGLYPNPARGRATVRVPAGAGVATLTLLDALGRVVRTAKTPASQEYPLDLTGLAPGIYALRAQIGEAVATRSLVVE